MASKCFDPLAFVPSPDVVREKLQETQTLALRLFMLLDLSERMGLPLAGTTERSDKSRKGTDHERE